MTALSLDEICARIDAHLHRMERDPEINVERTGTGLVPFYGAWSRRSGSRARIMYISFQGSRTISKADATRYLAALDAGDTRRHHEVLREWEDR